MNVDLRATVDLTEAERHALQELSRAVYPPEVAATWPGRTLEWAVPSWAVLVTDGEGNAQCHVGIVLRAARWQERPVRVGGLGGVKTHPAARGRGLASTAIQRALTFFRERGDVDFALLVCEPHLIPFYERIGFRRFAGQVLVTQRQVTVPFTFNTPMTAPLRLPDSLEGTIDLQGPPW